MKTLITAVVVGVAVFGSVSAGWFSSTPSPKSDIQQSNDIAKEIGRNVPIPQLKTSSERVNVARRAELFDNEDKISYIYLVSYGKVMAFFTVKGKVSSLRSYMTPEEKIVEYNGKDCWGGGTGCFVVGAPDIDGTYGENVEGIFFFTTEGAYVEWKGEYMMSDQPLRLVTPPELVREVQ
jgi:hypothetical protein